jgi:hypothetical protein
MIQAPLWSVSLAASSKNRSNAPGEARREWWLIVEPDRTVDLCHIDPGLDVDL